MIGPYGEISEDFKMLLQVMADRDQEELQAQTGGEYRKSVTLQLATCQAVVKNMFAVAS